MLRTGFRALAVLSAWCLSTSAAALDFRWKAVDVTLDSEFSLGTALRADEPDPQRIGQANGGSAYSTNGDDGNLAFGRGDAVSAASQWASELSIGVGGLGLFASGRYLLDPVLDGAELYDSADYLPGKEFGPDELARKQDAVRDSQARQDDLLEAYLSAGMNLGDHPMTLKFGRQSLDWGSALRLTNGLSSLLALDQTRLRGAGHSIERAVIPAGMVRLSAGLARNLSLDGFYQYDWRPNVSEAAGTFFSVNDYLGAGGTQYNLGFGQLDENTATGALVRDTLLPVPGCFPAPAIPLPTLVDCAALGSTIPRAPDVQPRDRGQYGGALEFTIPSMNHMELSLFGARYHSRLPVLSGISMSSDPLATADSAAYFLEYPEDIRLWEISFSRPVRALSGTLHGELSRKDGQPLQIDDVELVLAMLGESSQINPVAGATLGNQILPGWRRHTVSQWTLGLTRAFGPRFGYDLLTFELEASGAHVHNLPPENVLRYEGPGTDTPGDAGAALMQGVPQQQGGYATASSWGYRAQLKPSFFNVAGALGLDLILRYAHDVAGVTPAPMTDFVKGRREASVLLDFSYLEAWGFELGYTAYTGAQNLLADRDYYEARIVRSF
jgi:hypothetical protein